MVVHFGAPPSSSDADCRLQTVDTMHFFVEKMVIIPEGGFSGVRVHNVLQANEHVWAGNGVCMGALCPLDETVLTTIDSATPCSEPTKDTR